MDIKVNGKIFYQIDSGVAALLLEAFPGAFEKVNVCRPLPGRFEKPTPLWAVIKNPLNGHVHVQCTIGARVELGGGPSEKVQEFFTAMGFPVPEETLAQYETVSKQPTEEQKSARDLDALLQAARGDRNKHTGLRGGW